MGFVRSTLSLAIRSALPLATERTQERDARIISGIESTILVVVVNLFSTHNVPLYQCTIVPFGFLLFIVTWLPYIYIIYYNIL